MPIQDRLGGDSAYRPRAQHKETSGKPDDLLSLFESGEPRRSLTQAKKKG
jgi:hypothetical protein